MIQLNKGQQRASELFMDWWYHPERRHRPWFELSGAAGTGKTTVVRHIIEELGISMDDVLFVAFVGKAALQLRLSGVPGRTFHSVMYVLKKFLKRENGKVVYKDGVPEYVEIFVKVESLPSNIKLIVLDEGGMVSEDHGRDILSFGIPLFVLGDLHQLPPVFGRGMFLQHPDVILDEIMRQNKDSQIIYLSQLAMHGVRVPYGEYGDGECLVIHRSELNDDHLRNADLVICATNDTRDIINWYVRKNIYGISSPTIEVGDKLICRKNYWDILLGEPYDDIALVNGMIGYVTNVYKEPIKSKIGMGIDFRPEFSPVQSFNHLNIDRRYILSGYEARQAMFSKHSPYIQFELGYCSTCHLAQGSQYDHVLVYNEVFDSTSDYYKRWLYTAITRAKKKLTIVN